MDIVYQPQDLAAINAIFSVKQVQSSRGTEFYFIPKLDGLTQEKWDRGTESFVRLSQTTLEPYTSSVHGPVYRTVSNAPLPHLMLALLQEAIKQIRQVNLKKLASCITVNVYQPSAEQSAYCILFNNPNVSAEQVTAVLSRYFDVTAITFADGSKGYIPENPEDARFLQFISDVCAVQQAEAQQAVAQPTGRRLICGVTTDPLAHSRVAGLHQSVEKLGHHPNSNPIARRGVGHPKV